MLAILLAAIVAMSGHGAPHDQVNACEASITHAMDYGQPLLMRHNRAIAHNCGKRSGLDHRQREHIARYVQSYANFH